MSLISDALKRQEQLRGVSGAKAPGTPREWKVESEKWKETDDCRSADGSSAYPKAVDEEGEVSNVAHLQCPREANEPSALRQAPSISSSTRISGDQCEADEPSAPRQKDNRQLGGPGFVPAATVKRSNRQTVKPVGGGVAAQNPFLERERVAARRPNQSVLLMPILGLIVLLVLLFLRREFIPQEGTETGAPYSPRKVEESAPAREEGRGNREQGIGKREQGIGKREQGTGSGRNADEPSADGRDEAQPSQTVDEGVELSDGASVKVQREADEPSALRQGDSEGRGNREEETGKGAQPLNRQTENTSDTLSVSASSATLRDNPAPHQQLSNRQTVKPSNQTADKPTNRQTDKPATLLAEASPQPPVWPAFTLTGIAVGRERLAILNTGEMLLAGETSKCGVKVEKVNAATVVFTWGGEIKTLRKGEHSDKPAD